MLIQLIQVTSPDSELSKTFLGLKNPLNIKEVMSQNVQVMLTLLIQVKSPDSEHYVALISVLTILT